MKPCTISQSATDLKVRLPVKATAGEQHYYGIQTLNFTGQWQALGSLSPGEVMTHYHTNPPVNLEFGYSERDNLYSVRKKPGSKDSPNPVTIDFLITVPSANPPLLPSDIRKKIQECQEFDIKSLDLNDSLLTGAEFLEVLESQKAGACRHRTLVFKAWMDRKHPELPTRIVNNDCHSFIEIRYKNQWLSCDLGGYPAKLVINEPLLEKPTVAELTTDGTIETPLSENRKRKYFPTKKTLPQSFASTPLFMEHLLSSEGDKKLIQLRNRQHLNGFRYHLQQYSKHTSRPCFYVHSPEDLICSAPFIKKDGTQGTMTKGPGGPLHDFLMAHRDDGSKPVLVVNYDGFSASEIVRFNALLDKERSADGSPLPANTQVVGLMNPDKPGAYDGADFRSRFDAIIKNPLSGPQLFIPPLTDEQQNMDVVSHRINLYGGADWQDRLLGHWVMQGQTLHFVKGALLLALENNKTHIELNNAPWGDEAFVAFWQEALLKGSFNTQGDSCKLPEGFRLSQAREYSFQDTSKYLHIHDQDKLSADTLVLNNALLPRFFGLYHCNKQNESIQYLDGLLKQHQGKKLDLYLSDDISLDSWALFLDTCKTHNVHINLAVAPGVTLPEGLGIKTSEVNPVPTSVWQGDTSLSTCCIQSTDIDVTLRSIKEECFIIDVSEVNPADLLVKLDGSFDADNLSFTFISQDGALIKALEDKKTVVLKGFVSTELKEHLSELLLQRQLQGKSSGRVVIISEQADLFPMIPSFRHMVTAEDKKALVTHSFNQAEYEKYSLAELNAMAHYQSLHPDEPAANTWQGLSHLPPSPSTHFSRGLQLNDTAAEAAAFNQGRLSAVENALESRPFVFLAGKTGVGKTTFIHEVWKKKYEALHIGEESMRAWARDDRPGIKTLFIDEANISSRQWSEFEGLFHIPPRILIGNELIKLTPEHKVIFAGNPLSYGGERQIPALFAHHGNSLVFEPMTPAYLYEELLRPIFEKSNLNSRDVAEPILNVAQYLDTLAPDKCLLTPRELSMMALLTLSYCNNIPGANPVEVARYYAYTLAQEFVPENAKAAFASLFNTVKSLPDNHIRTAGNILLNATNKPAFLALSDALDLRTLRQKEIVPATGGLGGVVIEGEPGLGKTELIIQTLIARGLKKGNLTQEHPDKLVFYVLPVSMAFEDKKQVLLKAFHEGAVVFIDEINSAPMMERLLNDLLMGKDPQGNTAKKPGFMVIGAQNPPTMAGRNRASSALAHRLQKVVIPEYPENEMVDILIHKQLPADISQEMVTEYLDIRQSEQDSSSTLCFRDVLKRAEQEITAITKMKQDQELQNQEE